MIIVALDELILPDWGWHTTSPEGTAKLSASLHRFGQIQALLVRQIKDGYEIVDGRRRFQILQQMATTNVWVHDLGRITKEQAIKCALALELSSEIDYVHLAACVETLKEDTDFVSLPVFHPLQCGKNCILFCAQTI